MKNIFLGIVIIFISSCIKPSHEMQGTYSGSFSILTGSYSGKTIVGSVSDNYVTFVLDCPTCPGHYYLDLNYQATRTNVKIEPSGDINSFEYSYPSANGGDITSISGTEQNKTLNYTFSYNTSDGYFYSGSFSGTK